MKSTIEAFSRILVVASIMWLGLVATKAYANVLQLDGWTSTGGRQSASFSDSISSSRNELLSYSLPRNSVNQNGLTSSPSFLSGSSSKYLKISASTKTGTGSYGGAIIVNPVPEPQTYAMLLIGLGLVAFSARRRKDDIDY